MCLSGPLRENLTASRNPARHIPQIDGVFPTYWPDLPQLCAERNPSLWPPYSSSQAAGPRPGGHRLGPASSPILIRERGSSVDICNPNPPMHPLQHPRPIIARRRPRCRCQGRVGDRHGLDGTTSASVLLGFCQGCSRWPPAPFLFPNPFPPDVPVGIAPSLHDQVT